MREMPIRVGAKTEDGDMPTNEAKQELLSEPDADASLREEWAKTMENRRTNPIKRQKAPNMQCMSTQSAPVSVGDSLRNRYCVPTSMWMDKYGTLTHGRLMLRRVTTGELVDHVVFPY